MYLAAAQGPDLKLRPRGGATTVAPSSLLTNLISYWTFDESSDGSAPVARVDSVVATGNDLTDNNTTPSAAGKISNGINPLIANSEYLSHTSNASLNLASTDWTWNFWIKPGVSTDLEGIISKYQLSGAYLLWFRTNGGNVNLESLTTRASDSIDVTLSDTGHVLTLGTWYMVTWKYSSGDAQVSLTVNAGTPATVAMSSSTRTNTDDFRVGSQTGTSRYLTAVVDELGFWKKALSASDITNLYNSGTGVTYPFTGVP